MPNNNNLKLLIFDIKYRLNYNTNDIKKYSSLTLVLDSTYMTNELDFNKVEIEMNSTYSRTKKKKHIYILKIKGNKSKFKMRYKENLFKSRQGNHNFYNKILLPLPIRHDALD